MPFTLRNDWYCTRVTIGGSTDTIRWDPSIFQLPCKCCGSNNHAVLRQVIGKLGDYEEAAYSCPIIAHSTVEAMLETELMSQKYIPDPYKLARHHHYCLHKLQQVMKRIRSRGAGRHMHEHQLEVLESEALKFSNEVRDSWIFKRESNMEGDEEDKCLPE